MMRTWARPLAVASIGIVGVVCAALSQASVPIMLARGMSTTVMLAPQVDPGRGVIDYRSFDAKIRGVMARPDMVGLSVAVIEDGRIAFAHGYGTTALGSGEPVTDRTVFRWASLSKGVAATMLGTLATDGRLSLEQPLSTLGTTLRLPLGNERRATVDDLLSHRLGLVKNALDNRLEAGVDPHVLRGQLAGLPQFCVPGACHTYQNVAFDAASEIVQNVTGRKYQQAVEARLFAPLGMIDARHQPGGPDIVEKLGTAARRTAHGRGQRHLLPGAGSGRDQFVDPRPRALDAGADGGGTRRRHAARARPDPCAANLYRPPSGHLQPMRWALRNMRWGGATTAITATG